MSEISPLLVRYAAKKATDRIGVTNALISCIDEFADVESTYSKNLSKVSIYNIC